MRQSIALAQTAFRCDVFIAAGKGNGLERDESNLFRIIHCETDDRSDLIVVYALDQSHNQNDLHARLVQIVDGPQFHVEEIADLTVTVGVVSDTVELQIYESQSGFGCLAAKFFALCELDPVRRRLYAGVPDLPGVRDSVDEVGRQRWLAARELNGHLPPRFDPEGIVHDLHDFFPSQLMDITYLVGIHEAWVAHHVAAIREINREYGAAAMLDRTAAVVVKVLVVMCRNVAAWQGLFDPFQKFHIDGH